MIFYIPHLVIKSHFIFLIVNFHLINLILVDSIFTHFIEFLHQSVDKVVLSVFEALGQLFKPTLSFLKYLCQFNEVKMFIIHLCCWRFDEYLHLGVEREGEDVLQGVLHSVHTIIVQLPVLAHLLHLLQQPIRDENSFVSTNHKQVFTCSSGFLSTKSCFNILNLALLPGYLLMLMLCLKQECYIYRVTYKN